jgi:SMC interacting uncharacterized protein involved in chromosome segregation
LNIRRSSASQGREGLVEQTQAVADLKNKIMKAKHENSNSGRTRRAKKSINEKQIKIKEPTNKNIALEKHRQFVRERITERKKELEPKQAKQ